MLEQIFELCAVLNCAYLSLYKIPYSEIGILVSSPFFIDNREYFAYLVLYFELSYA